MDRRRALFALMAAALPFPAFAGQCADAAANGADMAWLIDQLAAHYAYLPDRHVDLDRLRAIYVAQAKNACDAHAFLGVLEQCLAEFHDHHIEAGVNNAASPQLVPTGAEAWAAFHDGRAIIEAVRPASSLMREGVRAGDEVIAIADRPVREAVAAHAPKTLTSSDPEADDYTLRVLLAGTHSAQRIFTARGRAGDRRIVLPPHEPAPDGPPLTLLRPAPGIALIRVENSLGDNALVAAFDRALEQSRDARGLILDLRNTPSGGNTDVAEPILGRFVTGHPGYQRVLDPPHREWVRKVKSRGETVAVPMVVLCSRWTGSMGEGMTIGLDGLKRATVVGTRMAGLCGATSGFLLPNGRIEIQFPTERLYHLDGTPRERWSPPVLVDLANAPAGDPILARGVSMLREKSG